jgi:hypothetical protein
MYVNETKIIGFEVVLFVELIIKVISLILYHT